LVGLCKQPNSEVGTSYLKKKENERAVLIRRSFRLQGREEDSAEMAGQKVRKEKKGTRRGRSENGLVSQNTALASGLARRVREIDGDE